MSYIIGVCMVLLVVIGRAEALNDTCGDAVCGSSENCDTCSKDCGACAPYWSGHVDLVVTQQWSNGYCANVIVKNEENHIAYAYNLQMIVRHWGGNGMALTSLWNGYFDDSKMSMGILQIKPDKFFSQLGGSSTMDPTIQPGFCMVLPPVLQDQCFDPANQLQAKVTFFSTKCMADYTNTCPSVCGDGVCGSDEDCNSCAVDCKSNKPNTCLKKCGDGICNAAESENCANCAEDCICAAPCSPSATNHHNKNSAQGLSYFVAFVVSVVAFFII